MLLNSGPVGLLQVRWVPYSLETIYCPCLFFLIMVLCEASPFSTHTLLFLVFLGPRLSALPPSSLLPFCFSSFLFIPIHFSLLLLPTERQGQEPKYGAVLEHSQLGGIFVNRIDTLKSV